MKKQIITTVLFLLSTISYAVNVPELDANTQEKVIDRVKEYCGLMKEFSENIENIDKMETIFSLCENNNVSVFNDLTNTSTRDFCVNSMPLQQYMMKLTNEFENKVKTSYSGYRYVKLVVQPSPLKEFDAARYAFVKVKKLVDAKGIKGYQNLNIVVNVSTMKVSSTISEDYEDPQKAYLQALEMFNSGNFKAAIPLFCKICELERFSGRYRAKAMLGWIYAEQKEYKKANDYLRESYAEDPLGSVILASKVLLVDDAPANYINYTEAGQILQKVSNVKDKEIPFMHLLAKSAIVDAFDLSRLTFKFFAINEKMADELIEDAYTTDAFKLRGYFIKAFLNWGVNKNNTKALEAITKAKMLLKTSGLVKKDYERWDLQLSFVHLNILNSIGDIEGRNKVVSTMRNKPYCIGFLGNSLIATKDYRGAMEMFEKAAMYGDASAAYIMSLSYLPLHTPLEEYEKKFIEETKKAKDETVVHNWKAFVDFLMSARSRSDKKYEDFFKWNQKAMGLGDINAKEDYAYFESVGVKPFSSRNIPHALMLACETASMGLRSGSLKLFDIHNFSLEHEMNEMHVPFEQTQTIKTLQALDEQGNIAASYLLYNDYLDIKEDTALAVNYLKKSVDGNFFYAMRDYAEILLDNERYEEAEQLCVKMEVYPNAFVSRIEGDIYKEYHKDYKKAQYLYGLGVKYNKDPECCDRLGDLYKEGLGVKKNPNLAKSYYNLAIAYYKPFGFGEGDEVIQIIRKKIKEVDGLASTQANAITVKEMIAKLNGVLDSTVSEDERISRAMELQTEIFASPQAKVKTMDATGKTVVATETAEDFMIRLATMKTDKRLVGMYYKKTTDKNFKLTELTVRTK